MAVPRGAARDRSPRPRSGRRRMRRPAPGAGEAGFTLMELMVALALVGLLTVLVFGGLRISLRAWTRTHDDVAQATDLWAVESLLSRTIAMADRPSPRPMP